MNQVLLNEDTRGRADVALVRVSELVVRRHLEPRLGFPVWDRGGKELVERFVTERLGVPSTPLTLVDVARELGILPREVR